MQGFRQTGLALRSIGGKFQYGWWKPEQHCLAEKENTQSYGEMPHSHRAVQPSDVLAAVGTQDVIPLGEEASAHQGQGALLAVEAVVVPLPFLEGDVLCATDSCRRGVK